MPQPRRLSDFTERDVLAEYRAANGARGTVARLATKYGLSWQGMKVVLKRLERGTQIQRSTMNVGNEGEQV